MVFVFNLGNYKLSVMMLGFCMDVCGIVYFIYVGLKGGNFCFCFNFMVFVNECFLDVCDVFCFGFGNFKCGGEIYIFVYKLV